MVPYRRGYAEVSALRRVVMAHVPGAKIVEVGGRGRIRVMMDDMMHEPVPPVSEHHADGEAVRDIESHAPPRGHQDSEADPRWRADERQRRGMVKAVHGRKVRHSMQCNPVQGILGQCPEDQPRHGGTEPFRAAGPSHMIDIDRRQRDEYQRIDDEVRVIAQFAELHSGAPRWYSMRYLTTNYAEC